jgi:hypothetical protein
LSGLTLYKTRSALDHNTRPPTPPNPTPTPPHPQVDTKDILFIVGGAFIDLERQLMESRHQASIGFGNKARLRPPIAACFCACFCAASNLQSAKLKSQQPA